MQQGDLWDEEEMRKLEAEMRELLSPTPRKQSDTLVKAMEQAFDSVSLPNDKSYMPQEKPTTPQTILEIKENKPVEVKPLETKPRANTKTLFKVQIPGQGFVTVDFVPTMSLQQLLVYIARKRRFEATDGFFFTFVNDTTPIPLEKTLGELKDTNVRLNLPGQPEQEHHSPKQTRISDILVTTKSFITRKSHADVGGGSSSPSVAQQNSNGGRRFDGKGWLTKEGGKFKTWRRRWMVLKDKKIFYAKQQNSGQAGVIDLGGVAADQVILSDYKNKKNLFSVQTPTRTYYLQAESAVEREQWIQAIKLAIGQKDSKKVGYADFDILNVVGKGNFGKVLQVRKKDTGQILAMKVLDKKTIIENDELDHTLTEKNILANLVHPFLVHLYYSFQTLDKLFFVMDFINGGDVFFHLQNDHFFAPERTRFYAAQIVCGLEYLHVNGVIYRDLKAENLILNDDGYILMTDFGISKQGLNSKESKAMTFCGTPEYLAPEILQGNGYTKAVDWWALGILIFEMLSGNPPFYSQNIQTMYSKIASSDLTFPDRASFDDRTKSLIKGFLERDPNKRLTDVSKIRNHPYFEGLDWERLLQKELKPPYVPNVKDKSDTSMVDPMFTRENARLTVDTNTISIENQKKFQNFTYVTDNAED